VAKDEAGNAMVAWGQAAGDSNAEKGLQAARYAVGSGWEAPVAIEPTSIAEERSSAMAQVGFDADGNAIVVWSHSARPGIYANRWSRVTGWATAMAIAGSSATGADENVRLAIDRRGHAMVLWNQQNGSLLASRWAVGGRYTR
jgi:hypothetical protein